MQNDFNAPRGSVKPALKLKPIPLNTNSLQPDAPFETPEQVSAHEQVAIETLPTAAPMSHEKPQGSGHHWFNLPWPPTKHEIALTMIVLFIAGFTATGFMLLNKSVPQPKTAGQLVAKKVIKQAPKPSTVAATLTGLPVAPELNQRPVVGVMIENSQISRPQSGLSSAGVIFEAIAEGGITRFLGIYQDQQPTSVGPVRSARPYFVQWNEGFRAAYAHVGGSPDALADIKSWGVQNLDQFANSAPYHRVPSRPAPHNLYSSIVDLAALASQKGFTTQYSGFERKAASPAPAPTASSIDFTISSALYNSHFAYDAASNSYLRSEGGAPQLDANTGKQLAPNVVIGLVMPLVNGSRTAQGGAYSNYNPIGSGQAYVFQDGNVSIGTWHKASNTSQISFTDAAGLSLKLNPGQTWLTALPSSSKASYR